MAFLNYDDDAATWATVKAGCLNKYDIEELQPRVKDLLMYIWNVPIPSEMQDSRTSLVTSLQTNPSFYKREFPLDTRDSAYFDLALPSNSNPFLLQPDAKVQKAKADMLQITDSNNQSGKSDIAFAFAESGASKTSAAFLVAAEKYSIYVEVAKSSFAEHGGGMTLLLSGIDSTRAPIHGPIIRADSASRALALLSVYLRGRISTPYEWLLAQIGSLRMYFDQLYDRLRRRHVSPADMKSLFEDLKKVFQYQVPFIVDKVQVMTATNSPNTHEWGLFEHYCREMCSLSASLILIGCHLTLAHSAAVVASVTTKNAVKVHLITSFVYLLPDDVRWSLSEALDLSGVDDDLFDHICFMLQGRPLSTAEFIVHFCKYRNDAAFGWKSSDCADKSDELKRAFQSDILGDLNFLNWHFRRASNFYRRLPALYNSLPNHTTPPLDNLVDLYRVSLLSPTELPTVHDIPLLAFGIVPLEPLGQDVVLDPGDRLPPMRARPIGPLVPMAIESYNRNLYSLILKRIIAKDASLLAREIKLIAMCRILELKDEKVVMFLSSLQTDGKDFDFPNWLGIWYGWSHRFKTQSIHRVCHLDEFMKNVDQATKKEYGGIYGHLSWLEVGALMHEEAGSDGVIPLHDRKTGRVVLISFSHCWRTSGDRWEHQLFRSSIYNQYMQPAKKTSN